MRERLAKALFEADEDSGFTVDGIGWDDCGPGNVYHEMADAVIEELRDPTDKMWKAIFGLWLSPILQRLRIRKWNRVIDAMKGGE